GIIIRPLPDALPIFAAALLHRAVGEQLTCIFVNNGVLRGREAGLVREIFGRHFKIKLHYEDASKLFLKRLRGVTDPERKRKIIGDRKSTRLNSSHVS